jgi:hypothetical protein
MNKKSLIFTLLLVCGLIFFHLDTRAQKVSFSDRTSERKIDVLIDGKLITSYFWPENVYKPVLYPVYTTAGTEITRGFPLKPRAGERDDHIHQVGIWLNYGNVNGFDFWGNGSTGKKSENGGEIKHLSIEKMTGGKGEGLLSVKAAWLDPSGKEMMTENTDYHFIPRESGYYIDRITSLTATGGTISMKDTKEGMFAIRVARQLELPSKENAPLLDASLKPGTEKASENKGVTGNYLSSEGVTGDAVWSTRAKWMELTGSIGNENISIVICDHPKNPGYPTYWHARGYGLFSANPLGANDFTQGKQVMNFSIPSGQTVIFRYRVVVKSGQFLSPEQINDLCDEFGTKN